MKIGTASVSVVVLALGACSAGGSAPAAPADAADANTEPDSIAQGGASGGDARGLDASPAASDSGDAGCEVHGAIDPIEVPGMPTVLVFGQNQPRFTALDDTHLYWSNALGGSIARVPKTGGCPTIIATHAGQVGGIDVANGVIHYVADGPDWTLYAVPVTGGTPAALGPSGFATPRAHGDSVYHLGAEGGVWRVPKLGGAAESFIADAPPAERISHFVLDDTAIHVVVLVYDSPKQGQWTLSRADIRRVPLGSGAPGSPEPIASLANGTLSSVSSITIRSGSLYVATASGRILAVSTPGGAVQELAAEQHPLSIASSGAHVYWSNDAPKVNGEVPFGQDQILRAPLGGGPVEVVAGKRHGPRGLLLETPSLYWADSKAGKLLRYTVE